MAHKLRFNREPTHVVYKLIILYMLICPSLIQANPGDELEIISPLVNLRAQPDTGAEILLKLGQGRRVVEVRHQGEWVEVYVDRDDIGTGWIHETLLAPIPDSHTVVNNHSDAYNRFLEPFNKLNDAAKLTDGTVPFSAPDEYTNNRIRITATAAWLQTDQPVREQTVAAIFKLWGQAVGPGLTAELVILDAEGAPVMSMFR